MGTQDVLGQNAPRNKYIVKMEFDMSESGEGKSDKGNLSPEKRVVEMPGHPTHPIALAIEAYLHAARDVKFALRTFMPVAQEFEANGRKQITELVEQAGVLMNSGDPGKGAYGAKLAMQAIRGAARYKFSDVSKILEQSLFLSLFSAFDVFTGDLLRAMYTRKPELLDTLNRSIPLKDVLSAPSIESLKSAVLDDEIETFRRKSYSEQFDALEGWFKIPLKKFDKWPMFIEASQRRNLLTHCGGLVSEQYRAVCKKEGVTAATIAPVGERLGLGPDYLMPICELMMEVGLKLGQTLWRKILPEELDSADEHLHSAVYDALAVEQWARAETFSVFFVAQHKLSSDLKRRMAVMNLGIALRHLEKTTELKKLLGDFDWSASLPEFHLAEAILLSNYDAAAALMRKIGPQGQILKQQSYHTWPLFNGFRETPTFLDAYESIYGHAFVAKVQESAAQVIRELAEDEVEGAPTTSPENSDSALLH